MGVPKGRRDRIGVLKGRMAEARIVDPVEPDVERRGVAHPEEVEVIYEEVGAHDRLDLRLAL
jgi:hypothetical protein